ncbi:GDSL-type esterase/lipase family protein [Nocardia sp. CWNU-33]|uniref:GDSL-type esterase/lipase family protein n=1 Tax=Nocardia sp. CWNU-33 TaxID=3392117 RepID=UPI00398E3797
MTFGGGYPTGTAQPGADIVTDPVPISVTGFQPLAVTMYTDRAARRITGHALGNATSYYTDSAHGDHTGDLVGTTFARTTTRVPYVAQLDVLAPQPVSTIVAFGDSITDGHVAADFLSFPQLEGVVDRNVRYPDFLQRRLDDVGAAIAVANAGIGGNRLLANGLFPEHGPAGESRIDADVLALSGVTDVIVDIGINDLGTPIGASYEQLVAGYTRIIDRFHRAGVRVHLATLAPASNAFADGMTSFPPSDPVRIRVNSWIRSQPLADSVIDFDAALRDPKNPSVLDLRYASADNLHPSSAGYQRMAETVDLAPFASGPLRCRR